MDRGQCENQKDLPTEFGFGGANGTSSAPASLHEERFLNQQRDQHQDTLVGFNEVQKAMITSMFNESLVSTVSKPQVPNFFKDRPELWFILMEAEFNTSKIRNDETKYYSVIRALDPETLQQITDILYNPPVLDKYKHLKETLIRRTSESRSKQIHRLLREMDLGEKKPTQLLREMRELAGDSMSDDMLHQLWLDRMPNQIKPLLVASANLTLNALAEVADRVTETIRCSYVMATSTHGQRETTSSSMSSHLEERLDKLQQMMFECMKEIKEIKIKHNYRPSRPKSRSRSQSYQRSDKSSCYYHHHFGDKANKCVPPCSFKPREQGN